LPFSDGVCGFATTEAFLQRFGFTSLISRPGTLDVLACAAFKQPISQAEIDQLFESTSAGLS
jgi:chromosome segregation and condensation protein ScpB